MTNEIKKNISEILGAAQISVPVTELSVIKMRASISFRGGKVLYFVFDKNSTSPIAVAKHTEPGSVISAVQELKNLESVRTVFKNTDLIKTLPIAYGTRAFVGGELSVESYVGDNGTQHAVDEAYITATMSWLKDSYAAHQKTELVKPITAETLKEKMGEYEKIIPGLYSKPEYGQKLYKFIDVFFAKHSQLMGYPQHGDFHSGNILLINNGIQVIDWGRYHQFTLPAVDALFFLRRCPGGLEKQSQRVQDFFALLGLQDTESQNFCLVMSELFEALERYAIGNTPYTSDFFPIFFERNTAFFI